MPPPGPIVSNLSVPVLLPAAGAWPTGDLDGVTITVAPVPYRVVPQVQESADDLYRTTSTAFDGYGRAYATPVEVTRVALAPVPVVTPNRVAFIVTVTNHSCIEFHGRGATLQFVTPGKPPMAVDGLGLAAMAVPPGGQDQVTVYGPLLSAVDPGATVGLQLTGVPAVSQKGSAGPPTVAWWYVCGKLDHATSTDPIVIDHERPIGPTVTTAGF
jgi:hypothetical protein